MKSLTLLVLSALLCNAAFCDVYEAAPVTVTFALTQKWSMGALYPRDDAGREDKTQDLVENVEYSVEAKDGSTKNYSLFGRKAVTYKIGNREIIQSVGDFENPTNLTLLAQPVVDLETVSGSYTIFIYDTKNKEFVQELFSINLGPAIAGTGSGVETTNAQGETVSVVRSGSGTFESVVSIDELGTGLFTGSGALRTYLSDPSDKTSVEAVGVPGASRISSIIGGGEGGYVTGTISFGASKLVRVTVE
jgi:hypothetical protein